MIPYLPQPEFTIFGITIYAFNILILISIILGYRLVLRKAKDFGLDPEVMRNVFYIVLPSALILCVIFQTLWYFPERITWASWYKIDTWTGISSFGGFLGAALALIIYFSRKSSPKFIDYAEPLLYAFVFGWIIARFGCTLAHDHPGVPSNFLLAFNYPSGVYGGVSRHNLGFYEALYSIVLFTYLHFRIKNRFKQGWLVAVSFISYSIVRFLFETLRATDLPGSDARYLSLTPAQLGCPLLFLIGLYYYFYSRKPDTQYLKIR